MRNLTRHTQTTTARRTRYYAFISGIAFSLSLCLLVSGKAVAASFSFTKVVDTNTLVPGDKENFTLFGVPSLDNGNVAFLGGSSPSTTPGIYTNIGGSLNVVADRNTPVPNGIGNFRNFGDISFNNGNVAFYAVTLPADETTGIYTNAGGSLNVVVDRNTITPDGQGRFIYVQQPSLNNGIVAFKGVGANAQPQFQTDIYVNNGVLSVIANRNTPIPDGQGNFTFFGAPSLNNGSVAFTSFAASLRGVYINDGNSLNSVADTNTPIPFSNENFTNFGDLDLDDAGVAFVGIGNSTQGIYTNNGGTLSVIADTNTSIPSRTGNFASFSNLSINNGSIAFLSTDTTRSQGIYTTIGGTLTKVIDTNDSLNGLTINSLFFGREGKSGNQIAFKTNFVDGSQSIYVATLNSPTSVPEHKATWGILAVSAMCVVALKRRQK
ncbi:hypothetical protein NIES4071_105230 (plasmid) [Calothrix sp. NIES-4071]|nr:hypothetical protein NIES4071_105230 [Calothrix sp. NIES-4071]BAZ64941.1 hypothetical protein NIES4105_106740 [Calothrix sp. NIES-4105]